MVIFHVVSIWRGPVPEVCIMYKINVPLFRNFNFTIWTHKSRPATNRIRLGWIRIARDANGIRVILHISALLDYTSVCGVIAWPYEFLGNRIKVQLWTIYFRNGNNPSIITQKKKVPIAFCHRVNQSYFYHSVYKNY